MRVSQALAAEESRRLEQQRQQDQEVERIRAAISAVFVVGGDTKFLTLAGDVHAVVQEALELRLVRPAMLRLVREVVEGMGAVPVGIGGRPCFGAVRRHDVPVPEAKRASTELRKRLTLRASSKAKKGRGLRSRDGEHGVGGAHGAGGAHHQNSDKAHWDAVLAAEGMPAELPQIPRGGSLEAVGRGSAARKRSQDAWFGRVSDGVHRQPATVRGEIIAGAHERTADLLAAAELEVKVLRLRAEGLSLRKIGIRLNADKMTISRILKRAAERLGEDVSSLDD